jgi:hypothetical protein
MIEAARTNRNARRAPRWRRAIVNTRSLHLLAGLAACLLASGSRAAEKVDPQGPESITASEVFGIYVNRSWLWPTGAGHFASDRTFVAWSGEGSSASYAEGRWLVTNDGRMCFSAYWHYRGGEKPDVTCFGHRKSGGTIYQRKEPAGRWYVFRSAPAKPGNEHAKLVRNVDVEGQLRKAAAAVAAR